MLPPRVDDDATEISKSFFSSPASRRTGVDDCTGVGDELAKENKTSTMNSWTHVYIFATSKLAVTDPRRGIDSFRLIPFCLIRNLNFKPNSNPSANSNPDRNHKL